MSWPAQQEPLRFTASPWSYSCSVTPITSAPVRAASAATTLLSTPPDMATTMRASAGERFRAKSMLIGEVLFTRNSPCLARPSQPKAETRAGGLARHEGEFQAAAETSLEMEELLRALRQSDSASDRERQAAIA